MDSMRGSSRRLAVEPSNRWLIAPVALAVVAAGAGLMLWAGGWGASEAPSADPSSSSDASAVIQQFAIADRVAVEPFDGTMLDGSTFDSRSVDEPVAVYNVWGSWCGPCRREAPALRRAAEVYDGRVAFVGINVRDDPASARAFERALDIPYPSIGSADSGDALLAFGAALSVAAVPATVIVDGRGLIAARVLGPLSYATLRGLVDDVLAETATRDDVVTGG